MQWRRFLGIVLGGGLLGLMLTELALHAAGYWPAISWDWHLYTFSRVPDRDTILVNPSFRSARHYDTHGARRIVVALGDSITEGLPVGREAAWPALLETRLRRAGEDARVINMGLGDSGPDRQLRCLEKYVLPRLAPSDVIWAFTASDLTDNLDQPAFTTIDGQLVPLDASRNWIYRRRRIWDSIPLPFLMKRHSAILRACFHFWEVRQLARIDRGPAARAGSEDRIALELRQARRLAREHGFALHVVLIAPQAVYLTRIAPEEWTGHWMLQRYDRLRGILRTEGPFLEAVLDDGSGAGSPGTVDLFADPPRDPNIVGDRHFNEEGQRRLAACIAAYVESTATVTDPARP